MLAAVFDARANFCKKYPHLPRSNREWPSVVPTKIMQLSGGNTFANLGLFALRRSRPPWASPAHSWEGRGYLFRNFVLFNLTFRTCNLKGLCPFKSLSSEKPEISTFKLQVRKVGLGKTNFSERCPPLPQE